MTVGKNLKAIRKERQLTQKELAESCGLSRSHLSDLENDRYDPNIKTLKSLAIKFNVPVTSLIN